MVSRGQWGEKGTQGSKNPASLFLLDCGPLQAWRGPFFLIRCGIHRSLSKFALFEETGNF